MPARTIGWRNQNSAIQLVSVVRGVCVVCVAGFLAARGVAQAAPWRAGVAKVEITPELPMWMAGYAGRPRPAATKIHELWAKALVLEDARHSRAVLVTLDVTGIDRRFSLALRDELKEEYGLERRQIALCSSHTHSGPVTSDRFTWVFGLSQTFHRRRLAFLGSLHDKIVTIVGAAIGRLEPCRLRRRPSVLQSPCQGRRSDIGVTCLRFQEFRRRRPPTQHGSKAPCRPLHRGEPRPRPRR